MREAQSLMVNGAGNEAQGSGLASRGSVTGQLYPVHSPYLGNRVAYELREYQYPIFADRETGIVVLHWSRQIGKTFTLAAWAVDRLLTRPGRLVTVLSNSRENGCEFLTRCAQLCERLGLERISADDRGDSDDSNADREPNIPSPKGSHKTATYCCCDQSPDLDYKHMRMEVRITVEGQTGRIKVLAANPRTARGFSGDLILDEFAFHEDSYAIWEAAEPILASNADFLCRIASTGNGRHNLFYRMVADCRPAALTRRPGDCADVPADTATPPALPNDVCVAADASRRTLPNGTPIAPPRSPAAVPPLALALDPDLPPTLDRDLALAPDLLASNQWHIPDNKWDAVERVPTSVGQSADGAPSSRVAMPLLTTEEALPVPYELSEAGYSVSRMSRTRAWEMGVPIFDPNTRKPISPAAARAKALDKRSYDQNYELSFNDETTTLLTYELIEAAEREDTGVICEQEWTPEALANLRQAEGRLNVGLDVGRQHDLSVLTVVEDMGGMFLVRAILRMDGMRLPDQQARLGEICRLPKFNRAAIDMTGIGLGLFEYAQDAFGRRRIQGVNFATTVPATAAMRQSGDATERVRVTEALATELLRAYEEHRIQHPADTVLREDLRKPEKITTPGGRVSIAATRTGAGHADHFWSFALALEAGASAPPPLDICKPRWTSPRAQAYLRMRSKECDG